MSRRLGDVESCGDSRPFDMSFKSKKATRHRSYMHGTRPSLLLTLTATLEIKNIYIYISFRSSFQSRLLTNL